MVITSQAMRRNKKRQKKRKMLEVTKILRDDLEWKTDATAKQAGEK